MYAPLQTAFRGVQAGSRDGRNLVQRKVEIPMKDKRQTLLRIHRQQSPSHLDATQDSVSLLVDRFVRCQSLQDRRPTRPSVRPAFVAYDAEEPRPHLGPVAKVP